ncbi:MAG TPA: FAD-dependent monooxygenase [Candidatus Binataceae bacterium]|jgi:2-polyprenyl-6-methoxyphenol hydroxylase-like FAD-dependent oxidoreductase|nr:FAD-dependent monooxygenase [Candidatus Binataceae bacterium]
MNADGLKVGIVGGSIAGCTAAIELMRIGCEVTLFERTGDELKDRGAGIGTPTAVFESLVRRDLIDADTPYFPGRGFSRRWRTREEEPYGHLAWDQPGDLALLNWGVLYRNLRKRVPDHMYQAERRVVGLRNLGDDRAGIELADGTLREFDLVVSADGYTSLGRRTLFPEVEIEYAGYALWRGVLQEKEMSEAQPLQSGVHSPGYPGGHGIFYFVPGPDGSVAPGARVVNWGMYVPVAESSLGDFFTDKGGRTHEGSLPPGGMPLATETELKAKARERLPAYYNEIVERSQNTFAYAIYDCHVPAYRKGRICLAGDAGAFARPHTAAGALKSINDAIALGEAIHDHRSLEEALKVWDAARTETNNKLVTYGNQLGRALVKEIPDWSKMDAAQMQKWYLSIVEVPTTMRDQHPADARRRAE